MEGRLLSYIPSSGSFPALAAKEVYLSGSFERAFSMASLTSLPTAWPSVIVVYEKPSFPSLITLIAVSKVADCSKESTFCPLTPILVDF